VSRAWVELVHELERDPWRRTRIEERLRALRDAARLSDLREAGTSLAALEGGSARRGACMLREPDLYVSTLATAVAAMGGTLELQARFGQLTVQLVEPEPPSPRFGPRAQ
jgi:hypothetical protein